MSEVDTERDPSEQIAAPPSSESKRATIPDADVSEEAKKQETPEEPVQNEAEAPATEPNKIPEIEEKVKEAEDKTKEAKDKGKEAEENSGEESDTTSLEETESSSTEEETETSSSESDHTGSGEDGARPSATNLHSLAKFIDANGMVDYKEMNRDNSLIDANLSLIRKANILDIGDRYDRLAYYINAYNMCVMAKVCKKVKKKSSWKGNTNFLTRFIFFHWPNNEVAGKKISLSSLEKDIVTRFRDPLAYFALSDASRSGPKLRKEPFRGSELSAALNSCALDYVNRRRAVEYEIPTKLLKLSRRFKWKKSNIVKYGKDDLIPFLNRYWDGDLEEWERREEKRFKEEKERDEASERRKEKGKEKELDSESEEFREPIQEKKREYRELRKRQRIDKDAKVIWQPYDYRLNASYSL